MSQYKPNTINVLAVVTDKVKKVAAEVYADAVRICPQDTGNLARSITMKDVSPAGSAAFTIGTNVHYAPFVEFGTHKMAAQPYLGPALNKAKAKYG